MFGLLLKIALVAVVVVGVLSIFQMRRGSMPPLGEIPGKLKASLAQVDTSVVLKNLSGSLDNLVTNPDKNSPVVLGVKITNESISTVVDVLQGLPPEQVDQIKQALCAPVASPSPSVE